LTPVVLDVDGDRHGEIIGLSVYGYGDPIQATLWSFSGMSWTSRALPVSDNGDPSLVAVFADAIDVDGDGDRDIVLRAAKTAWLEVAGSGPDLKLIRHDVPDEHHLTWAADGSIWKLDAGDGLDAVISRGHLAGERFVEDGRVPWPPSPFVQPDDLDFNGDGYSDLPAIPMPVSADFNGDGIPDLLIPFTDLKIVPGLPDGGVGTPQIIAWPAADIWFPITADWDGNGLADIVFSRKLIGAKLFLARNVSQ
jgi:hypothetical protein